jgi:thiol-disulfide isomerase/thioredoxin
MIRKILYVWLFALLTHFSLSAQQLVNIELKSDDKSTNTSVLFLDKSWLRIMPARYTAQSVNGVFNFQFPLERNIVAELHLGSFRLPLYVQPGDSVSIQINTKPTPSVNISGNSAEENAFLQQFFTPYASMFDDTLNQAKMLATTIDAYEAELFKLKREQENVLKESEQYSRLSAEFRAFIEDQILYHYWGSLLTYPIARANSSTSILTVDPIPDVMLEGLKNVTLNDESALIADAYRNFVKNYCVYFTSKANGFKKFTDYTISADKKLAMARAKFDEPIFTYWLARFVADECGRLAPFMVKKLQSELKEKDTKEIYYSIVTAYCDALPAVENVKQGDKNSKGSSAASDNKELDLVDVDGKSVELSKYKGKVVYIDFWASWCGPCRQMMPFSKKIHEELTDKEKKQIVFLYISIDASKEAWLKGMKDMGMEGENVISPGNWQSKAVRYFQFNGIPRYMIMNKKGEIVDFNAKRPADPSILNDLRRFNAE